MSGVGRPADRASWGILGLPFLASGRLKAGIGLIEPVSQCRALADGEQGIEAASRLPVRHRSSTYRPAALPADTVAVDTVAIATYDAPVRR